MNRLPPMSSLMSPPEAKPFDSFNSSHPSFHTGDSSFSNDNTLAPITGDRKRTQSQMDLPSPPVTPYVGNKKQKPDTPHQVEDASASHSAARDPVLFPRSESTVGIPDGPLFGPELAPAAEALVEKHMATHMARFEGKANKPTREEYLLALSCVPIVSTQYNRNPGKWAMEERRILERQFLFNRYRPEVSAPSKLKNLAPAPRKRPAANSTTATPRVSRPRAKRTPRSTPKQKALDSFDTPNSSTPKPSRVIGTNRDDTDYKSLPDYSPPIATLHGNTKGLKADWKGQVLDLSDDPDRDVLDPAEVNLAATLRLTCATYLCSKRRIFEARLSALRIGKEFRKTDAQQACKIDVNKASKLWTAYEKVGWFKPEHFRQYI
ncbi:hypothetical protein FQN54_005803 [Arachnomyces sp. PD_36]|nr:hypothetical protein FQN54_005803 [Arachnomyces sp. PD_36]